ncbi:tetratricopeptide repeat protein, partial [Oxalobacter sp. OttesenSCG-928-P03]|nr:tetratricopeptide repeat protein [Oxalobacter sp. OttesenSCG-928-P03]
MAAMKPGKSLSSREKQARVHLQQALGFIHQQQFDAAEASYGRAIALHPDFAEAYASRGALYMQIRQNEPALADLDRAIELAPDLFDAWYHRGAVLVSMKHYKAALESLEKALQLDPSSGAVYNSIGMAFAGNEQLEIALEYFEKAMELVPGDASVYYNYASILVRLKQLDAGIEWYDKAIVANPDFYLAYYSKAFPLMVQGRFEEGLPLYEFRSKVSTLRMKRPDIPGRLWLGEEPIQGKTILLCHDMGYGDTIQLCRYAKLLSQAGAKVILQIPPALSHLMESLEGVDELFVSDEELTLQTVDRFPPFDVYCPLMSLLLAFKTRLDTIPAEIPYLYADPQKVAAWEKRLGSKTKPRVGLVWSGNADHFNDHNRSIMLAQLLPYLPDNCEYISLQKEVRDIDRIIFSAMTEWKHFGEELDDFADTAALCALMDVVVSVDTSVAHLSGALGRPTWVMLPFFPDWRWLLDRSDSPWYPGMRLYRQGQRGEWGDVFEAVRNDLLELGNDDFGKKTVMAVMNPDLDMSSQNRLAQSCFEQACDFHHQQQFDAALAGYSQAIDLNPALAEAYANRGGLYLVSGENERALSDLNRAIELDPDFAEAYSNRGLLYQQSGENELALSDLSRAVELNPALFNAWYHRGAVLVSMKHYKAALESLEKALQLNPSSAEVYNSIGMAFAGNEQPDIALEYYEKAIELNPDMVPAYGNYATALLMLNRFEAAIEWYDRAIALDPDYSQAYFNKVFPLLLLGRFEEGLPLYEQRFKTATQSKKIEVPGKLWLGEEPIQGKTILLCHEMGYGDTIQFCRYARLVAGLGAKVILQVPSPLASLMENLEGVDELLAHNEELTLQNLGKFPPFDVYCPLMSLPLAFQTRLDTIPAGIPYLHADPQKVAAWEKRLGSKTKPRVGLVWSGNAAHKNDHNRSIMLAQLLPYLPDNCEYISLQKEVRDIDRIIFSAMTEWKHFGEELDDFADTA